MTISPSLDPQKSPWKRGDVCTLGFKKNCFVLDHTPEYLEVLWLNDDGVERIPTDAIDSLLRVAHADSLGPDGRRTNSEYLQVREGLNFLEQGLAERTKATKSEKERRELDRVVRRIFPKESANGMLDTGVNLRGYLPLLEALGLHSKSVNGFTASSVL